MKNQALIFIVLLGYLFLYSCSEEEIISPPDNVDQVEQTRFNYFDQEKDEQVQFNSAKEVISYFEGTEYYDMVKEKMELIEKEKAYIEENKLYELPENDPMIEAYMEKFEDESSTSSARTEVAPGGRLFDGIDATGSRLSNTTTPSPRMRRSFRNRASSVRGGPTSGVLVLFDRTWFRGSSNIVIVLPFLTSNFDGINTTNFNNRTESFF